MTALVCDRSAGDPFFHRAPKPSFTSSAIGPKAFSNACSSTAHLCYFSAVAEEMLEDESLTSLASFQIICSPRGHPLFIPSFGSKTAEGFCGGRMSPRFCIFVGVVGSVARCSCVNRKILRARTCTERGGRAFATAATPEHRRTRVGYEAPHRGPRVPAVAQHQRVYAGRGAGRLLPVAVPHHRSG